MTDEEVLKKIKELKCPHCAGELKCLYSNMYEDMYKCSRCKNKYKVFKM